MKKKIKDLTFEEKEKICDRQLTCEDCPLRLVNSVWGWGYACAYDEEVDIDESNND